MTEGSATAQAKSWAAIDFSGPDHRSDLLRICLVPLFVVGCYQFDWTSWRSLVAGSFVAVAPWLGVPAVRLTFDSFSCNGEYYQFVTACTALDAFFGSIPLLWKRDTSVCRNALFLTAYLVLLSAVNLLRLEIGFVLYHQGVAWSLAHEAMAGVFYFGLFLWIARRRNWNRFLSARAQTGTGA